MPVNFSGTRLLDGELNDSAHRNQGMDACGATSDGKRVTVTVDCNGIIHQWGDAVTELVGHSADDALGRSLDIVIPPVLRPLHWWGFGWAMKRGRMSARTVKLPALRDDGGIVVVHATIGMITGDGGGTDGAVVRFVGVGSRWQGKTWQAALAPLNVALRIRQRLRGSAVEA